MMDWGDMGRGYGSMTLGWVLATLLLIGLVSLLVFVAVGALSKGRSEPAPPAADPARSAAESELELRYARGEIDAAALVEARSVLRQR
ncbi:hypothetical protein [Knoellia sp. Soil729]|uniref:hypothetical protein n=1 Tax=Knoellia sp. Soil729 TaxID=1736394 RepID=UPI0006FAEC9F|nr:hypothetical protein [Knoellia sp. Soil729]KRE42735.1 hypothetical protein ASG74_10185 [Knoellia sp. Soil729]